MAEAKTRRQPINVHEDEPNKRRAYDGDTKDELSESRGPLDDSGETRSDVEEEDLEDAVREEMIKFEQSFKGITKRYHLIDRIGEGTFSTVYKAEDLLYDHYQNDWDLEEKENKSLSPSQKRRKLNNPKPHYVAIKKIYVTSSPYRIMNELDLLHDLRNCDSICPLITAFRHQDQVIAILPYFRHRDFRGYFRDLNVADMRSYFRSLFTALAAVHRQHILHRDIKPTNFLYDTHRKQGVLVDFGLAERQGTDAQPCVCQLDPRDRARRITHSYHFSHGPMGGYPKEDTRPSLRANRAGTRGFRAPEVLFKCTAQTTKIDTWAAGIILLTMLSRRFPFFQSTDDIDAVIEMTTIFGKQRMVKCALMHGRVFETNIPTITENGYSLEKVVLWATDRNRKTSDGERIKLREEEQLAVEFLGKCLDLDAARRMSAEEALEHPFLAHKQGETSEDEMDVLSM